MSDQVTQQATPHGGSLDGASTAIASWLAVDPSTDTTPTRETQPEQVPEKKVKEPKQVPAAADEEATPDSSEQDAAAEETETPEETSQPKTWKVPVAGTEVEVTEDELLKGYSRTEDYTRKTQALAEQRRAWEEKEVAAVRQERETYATYLDQLKTAITQAAPAEPDWEALRQTVSPDVFTAEWVRWQAHTKQVEKIEAEQTRINTQRQTDAEEGFRQHVATQEALLVEKLPDLKDPEKAIAIKKGLVTFGQSAGFTPEELSQVTDHRLVLLLHNAWKHAEAQQKAPEIKNKIDKALEASAPGATRNTAPKANALAAAKAKLKQSGSVDDGAAAIAALLGG